MKILIIEDEVDLSDSIATYLSSENYICEKAFTYDEALEKVSLYQYDCILLDLGLPGGDGLDLLEEIKSKGIRTGIMIISARDSLDDKIKGLKIGADDYLAKPFSLSELGVRIYALIRRQQFSNSNILRSKNVEIDLLSKQVKVDNNQMILTKSEYDLLLFLIGNKNHVVSKNAIAEHISGDMAYMLDNFDFVYTHIKNLKSKLADAGCHNCIKTMYGLGYQWIE
jgi:DNA-binding response OmpR family regulator